MPIKRPKFGQISQRAKDFCVSCCYQLYLPATLSMFESADYFEWVGGGMSQLGVLPDVITANEAAKYLRVSKATVLRLANRGLIGVKIGHQWRFSRKIILNLINRPELLQKMGTEL